MLSLDLGKPYSEPFVCYEELSGTAVTILSEIEIKNCIAIH